MSESLRRSGIDVVSSQVQPSTQFSRPNRTADNRWTPARALWFVVTECSWKADGLSFKYVRPFNMVGQPFE